jgi:hypothetical protein
MEALLNLLWLVIACAAIGMWRGVWRRRAAPSMREWLALCTLLFLLFPVISLTDDLHEELALAECSTGTKHFLSSARCMAPQSHGTRPAGAASMALSGRLAAGLVPKFERIVQPMVRGEVFAQGLESSGRSPPIYSL